MSKVNPHRPAFPVEAIGNSGMTYRQWLVGQALGHCANGAPPRAVAEYAIQCADAIIDKLNDPSIPNNYSDFLRSVQTAEDSSKKVDQGDD